MEIWLMAKQKNRSVWICCHNIASVPSKQESSECNILGANDNLGDPSSPPPNFSNVTEGITRPIKKKSQNTTLGKVLEILWLNNANWLFSLFILVHIQSLSLKQLLR